MTDVSGMAVFYYNSVLPLADASILGCSPSIIGKTIMARDGKCSVHRNPSLAISVSALGLPIVRETYIRGSLIPQPSINVRGTVQINKQAKGMNPYLYSGIDSKTTTSVFASIH